MVTTTGGVKCWGYDDYGQAGDGPYNLAKFTPVDVLVPRTCYMLELPGSGGPAPGVSLPPSPGCPPNHYLAGTQMSLYAQPPADWRVQAWSRPASGSPGATVALLTMPDADIVVTVTYGVCHLLTLTGSPRPQAELVASPGCAVGRYGAGERVPVSVIPPANQSVQAWMGTTTTPAAGSQINFALMPNGAKTAGVQFETCHALSATHSGQGAPLQMAPGATDGCLTGGFVAGQMVALQAAPAAGWVVSGWTGTVNDASAATTNMAVMPAGPKSVGVVYAPAETRIYLPAVNAE